MPYPDEIIATMTAKYHLSESLRQQLHSGLLVAELRPLVEAGTFNPEDLLIRLALPDGPYISVLSPIAVKRIIATPAELTSLREAAAANPAALREWDNIKQTLEDLSALPRGRTIQRKRLAAEIGSKLAPLQEFILGHPVFNAEHFALSAQLFQYMNAITESIKLAARTYFEALLKRMGKEITDITFTPKRDGIQLGITMMITYMVPEAGGAGAAAAAAKSQMHRITYYIKTHQNGSTSQASSIKPVDPKELFVYKVLEYTGYGPKAHFFFNPLSEGGFFIATQDLAFTKIMDKRKNFTFFDDVKAKYNATPEDPAHDEARQAIICLDILTRILRLRDTTTNPGNFGHVTVASLGKERSKWKLLDFSVIEDAEFYLNPRIFEGFQAGNGVFNYDYAEFLRHSFRNPAYEGKKMAMADQIMAELHKGRLCQSRAG